MSDDLTQNVSAGVRFVWKSGLTYGVAAAAILAIYGLEIRPNAEGADTANIVFMVISTILALLILSGLSRLYGVTEQRRSLLQSIRKTPTGSLNTSELSFDAPEDALEEIGPVFRILLEHGPAFFAALGIVFTFFGLITGISKIDPNDLTALNSNINGLLAGVNVAFFSSLAGVTLSFVTLGVTRIHFSESEKVTEEIFAEVDRLDLDNTSQAILLRLEGALETRLERKLDALPAAFAVQLGEQLARPFEQISTSLEALSQSMHDSQKDLLKDLTDTFLSDFSETLMKPFQQLETALANSIKWYESMQALHEKTWKNLEEHVAAHQQQLASEKEYFEQIEQLEAARITVQQKQLEHGEKVLENTQQSLQAMQVHGEHYQRFIGHAKSITTHFDQVSEKLSNSAEYLQKVESNLQQAGQQAEAFAGRIEKVFLAGAEQSAAELSQRMEMLRVEGERTQVMQNAIDLSQKTSEELRQSIEATASVIASSGDVAASFGDIANSLWSTVGSIQNIDLQLVDALERAGKSSEAGIHQVQAVMERLKTSLNTAIETSEQRSRQSMGALKQQLDLFARSLEGVPDEFAKMLKRHRERLEDDVSETFDLFDTGASQVVDKLSRSFTHIQVTLDDMRDTTSLLNDSFQSLEARLREVVDVMPRVKRQDVVTPETVI